MSEKLLISPEQHEPLLEAHEHKALPDAAHAEPLRANEKDPMDLVEARHHVQEVTQAETPANPLERLQAAEKAAQQSATPAYIDQTLRQISLRRELQHIRHVLPAPDRALSKLIHQPVIRAVSETASRSVSRPSGLLGGGLVALLGTSGYLYYAKHLGFTYNYFVFFLLFIIGFIAGLALELLIYLTIRDRQADK